MKLSKLQTFAWIAGILSCLVAIIVNWERLEQFLKKCWACFSGLFDWVQWFSHPIAIPVFWIILLVGILVLLTLLLIWLIANSPHNQQAHPTEQVLPKVPLLTAQPNPLNYVNDEIFGVRWSWDYIGGMINDSHLVAFCPRQNCRCRLEAKTDCNRYIPHVYALPISLNCPRCGFSREFDSDMKQLKHNVGVEIERRINTGEYIKALTSHE